MIETITEEQLTPQQAEFWVRARQAVDMNNYPFVIRKQERISRFALKDLPLPGVPRITPFGVRSRFRSAIIMLLERAFKP